VRFVRVVVEHFRAIERAEVTFEPGLNVLHGPNDHGKSTLATAIRAVLLLPHGSSEAEDYIPWRGDFTPYVELTFADAEERLWRVTKSFSAGRGGSSELAWSNDGRDFVREATAREVDEKLRMMLEWGAPEAGSRAARGLPQTFLSQVLLAEQTDTDAILRESLEADAGESGRLRLTRALQAFARDPRFMKLLEQAEAECDQHFTSTGRHRRGRTSPLFQAAEESQRLRSEFDELTHQLRQTDDAEASLTELRQRVERLEAHRLEAQRSLETAISVTDARNALLQAEERLREIQAKLNLVSANEASVEKAAAAATARETDLRAAREVEARARADLESAKAAHVAASSDEAASRRALERAELENEKQACENSRLALNAREKEARRVLDLEANASGLDRERADLDTAITAASLRRAGAERSLEEALASLEQLRALLAFGRFKQAQSELTSMRVAAETARELRTKANEAMTEAADRRAAVASRTLPDSDAVQALVQLENEIRLAEASLGGGLTLSISPKGAPSIKIRVDDGKLRAVKGESSFDAARTLEISIADIAELRVAAGDADKRAHAEALRARWSTEAQPLLAAASFTSAVALAEARAAADVELRVALDKEKEAEHQSQRAADAEQRAREAATQERRVADLEAGLDGVDRDPLESILSTVGAGWEAQTADAERNLDAQATQARTLHSAAESELAALSGRSVQLNPTLEMARSAAAAGRTALGDAPDACLESLNAQKKQLAARAAAVLDSLEKLESGAGNALTETMAVVEASESKLVSASALVLEAEGLLAVARSEHDQRLGELVALKAQAQALPYAQATEDVRSCTSALEALGVRPSAASVATDIQSAQSAFDDAEADFRASRDELNRAEGALTQVGGAVVRERYEAVKAAHTEAEERQRQLELDADAWKLLRDTLKESEEGGTQHLGRALAGEVGRRFGELTAQRYTGVEIDPHLRVQNIEGDGNPRLVDVLSVGTRDQLATLLRLAIAESLGAAIILDDQLVQSDAERLGWFRTALQQASTLVQVVVITCRREDYVDVAESGRWTPACVDLETAIRRVRA
jgi:DNA repair exonuclease SbcCD ATPase subunit